MKGPIQNVSMGRRRLQEMKIRHKPEETQRIFNNICVMSVSILVVSLLFSRHVNISMHERFKK